MKSIYVLSATTENSLRVLQRVASIFTRHRLNIEQLNVFETGKKGVSHFNIVVHAEINAIDKLIKQLRRIVEMLDVSITNTIPLVESE